MKVKALGLSRKRGKAYVVRPDGKVIATVRGEAVQVARVKLADPEDYLYFIDSDGDLAREYKSRRQAPSYTSRPSSTKPASAKLRTRALYDAIEGLLFPTESMNLCTAGYVGDSRAGAAARKIYEKEFKRLAAEITRALVISPKFILLDEPFAGIDPIAVTDIQKIIFHLRDRGIGVLVTDHNVRETLRITDRAYIVHAGMIFKSGTPQGLAEDEEVRRIYLGTEFRLD